MTAINSCPLSCPAPKPWPSCTMADFADSAPELARVDACCTAFVTNSSFFMSTVLPRIDRPNTPNVVTVLSNDTLVSCAILYKPACAFANLFVLPVTTAILFPRSVNSEEIFATELTETCAASAVPKPTKALLRFLEARDAVDSIFSSDFTTFLRSRSALCVFAFTSTITPDISSLLLIFKPHIMWGSFIYFSQLYHLV